MFTRNTIHMIAAAACVSVSAISVQADTLTTFDSAVVTGATQAAGVWYTDRYAPADFVSPIFFDGDNRLKHSISSAEGADNRPGGFSSAFYNTQGRKYDLESGSVSLSIDLYVPSDWATTERRMAGLWGTAFDITDSVSDYPIIEFTSTTDDAGTPRFRGYNVSTGTWFDMGLPTGFAYDAWSTLEIELTATDFIYTVGDLTVSQPHNGSTYIGNVILQGHNTQTGVDYDIHWDNLTTAVPEPASLALLGLGGLAVLKRKNA